MNQNLLEELIQLVKERKAAPIRALLTDAHPADIAEVINQFWEQIDQIYLFAFLNKEQASDVLADLNDEVQENILEHLNDERLASIIGEMETDDAADILADLEDAIAARVLHSLDVKDSQAIRSLMGYEPDTAGGIMQTEVVAVRSAMKRDAIIEFIRANHAEVENLHYIYVVDDYRRLIGVLELKKLLLAVATDTAAHLQDQDVVSVTVDTDQEEVAGLFRKYDMLAVPVVDRHTKLLGRITVDDIIDVIDEEATQDAYLMVGLGNEDKVFTSPRSSMLKRLPWLVLNLFTAFAVSSVVGVFEHTIATLPFLAVLMPIVAGLGGNSGTQTLTVITRGIALGELTLRNAGKAARKEIIVGVLNGLIISSCATLIAWMFKGNIMLGAVLGLAMIANMFIAGLCGSLVPVVLKAIGVDPALASSVIITMLTDMGGFASFLGLASILL